MKSKKVRMSSPGPADTDPVFAAATEWLVRVQDPEVTPESLLAWQAWMREDLAHTEAFRQMEDVKELLHGVPHPPLAPPREMARDSYNGSVPLRHWQRAQRPPAYRWARAASALIAVVALALLAATSIVHLSAGKGAMVIATRLGENRSVQLADGSTVTLGGDSRVAVSLRARERDIDLLHGEAFFTVAHDPQRPFIVAAGRAVGVAVGTQFDVRRDSNRVVVDVIQGRVIVLPYSRIVPIAMLRAIRPRLVPVTVSAGEKTTVDSVEVKPPSHMPDPEEATSWVSGRLAFRMQPLGEVLQQVNRYSSKPIVIADPGIAQLKVTGTVVGGNMSGWVASLHSALGVVALDEPDRIVLERAQ